MSIPHHPTQQRSNFLRKLTGSCDMSSSLRPFLVFQPFSSFRLVPIVLRGALYAILSTSISIYGWNVDVHRNSTDHALLRIPCHVISLFITKNNNRIKLYVGEEVFRISIVWRLLNNSPEKYVNPFHFIPCPCLSHICKFHSIPKRTTRTPPQNHNFSP